MARLEVDVCDVCLDPSRDTTPWELGPEGAARRLLLCEEHAAPVVDILESVKPASAATAQRPAKKAPAKRATGKKLAASKKQRPENVRPIKPLTPEEIENLRPKR